MSDPQRQKTIIGITLGDYNGIGPEIILKALDNNQLSAHYTIIVYGSMKVLNRYRQVLKLREWPLQGIQKVEQANPKVTNVITCWSDGQLDVKPGSITPEAGKAAFACLKRGVEDLKAGRIHALVTAPINKDNIQSEEFKFPGHTEYLASEFEAKEALMFLVAGSFRVGVLTGHIPLGKVRSSLNADKLTFKIDQMYTSLVEDFGIDKPKIAVLGLNPHAGENGLLGSEEKEVIEPVIQKFRQNGKLVFGPFPADGFFGATTYKQYDAVLAMYHDQGLIPFKTIAFNEGVNFTAGLSAIRTSPDHGTAYSIAGKNQADPQSLLHAIYQAVDIHRYRSNRENIEKTALVSKAQPSETQHPISKPLKGKIN
jgi:4-hydroxythreonine-4-phosphate dehydrogenase